MDIEKLKDAFKYAGGRRKDGTPNTKYAFLTREEIKAISYLKAITASNGVKVIVRVIND